MADSSDGIVPEVSSVGSLPIQKKGSSVKLSPRSVIRPHARDVLFVVLYGRIGSEAVLSDG